MNLPKRFDTSVTPVELDHLQKRHGSALPQLINTFKDYILKHVHNDFIAQIPNITQEQKKIVMIFSSCSDDEAQKILTTIELDASTKCPILYTLFYEKTRTTALEYISKHFFKRGKYHSYGNDAAVDGEIDDFMRALGEHYPHIQKELKDIHKDTGFYASLHERYLFSHIGVVDELLEQAMKKELFGKAIPSEYIINVLYDFFASQALHFCDEDILDDTFKKMIQRELQDIFIEKNQERLASIEQKKSAVEKDISLQIKKWRHGVDSGFDQEISDYIHSILPDYPYINTSLKLRHTSKGFHLDTEKAYKEYFFGEIPRIISEDPDKNLLDTQMHRTLYKSFIKEKITSLFASANAARKNRSKPQSGMSKVVREEPTDTKPAQPAKQTKKLTLAQEKSLLQFEEKMSAMGVTVDIDYFKRMLKKGSPIRIHSLISNADSISITKVVSMLKELEIDSTFPEHEKKFADIYTKFSHTAQETLPTVLDQIEKYVRDAYKSQTHICIGEIKNLLGDAFNEEINELIYRLCTEIKVTVIELEAIKEEAKAIVQGKKDTEKGNDNSHAAWNNKPKGDTQVTQISTLEKFKTQPELLQAEDIITIFQERGRTIVNHTKFSKQLETLVTNNGKLFDWRRKKLIEYLSWDQAVVGKKEIVRYVIGQYRILKFPDNNNPPRIIRKGNQILSCINHDEYDKLLLMMKKNADIDHLL